MPSQIPESEISNYDFFSVNVLYSNSIGYPIYVGKEQYILTIQPISLISRSEYFDSLFKQVDFREGVLAIFEDSELSGNLKSLTSIWNYINGALEPFDTFRKLSYAELIQMLPFITEFRIKSKEFYDSYLKALTGFSTYTHYDVTLMRSSIPKLIIDLDDFFQEDKSLSNYWKQKLALGLANLEGPNQNLASISIKPIKTEKSEDLSQCMTNLSLSLPKENITYIPTMRSPLKNSF
jgi:hypothetical protein